MSIEDLPSMKEKAAEIARYYYKGFGVTIDGILNNAGRYLQYPEREDLIDDAYKWLKEIEDFYAKILFNTLHGKKEFYPLFVTNELLPIFRESMDCVAQRSYETAFRNLEIDAITIINVGRLYGASFIKILEKIREHPDARDFRVKIIDHKNKVWYF